MSKLLNSYVPKNNQSSYNSGFNFTVFIADVKALIKFRVLIANVIPVFAGFWMALYYSGASFAGHGSVLFLALLGSTFVMAGALILNNWYEVDLDRVMDRTKHRPTVTGNMSLNAVLIAGIVVSVVGFILLFMTTLAATAAAFVGWFTYVVLYTIWSKRKYSFNTIIGSVSGAVTPVIGWAAVYPELHIVPVAMFFILLMCQMPHTYAIAIRKYDEYKAAGVAMLPVVHGIEKTKWHSFIYLILMLPWPFFMYELGLLFLIPAVVLNIAWLVIGVAGFYMRDELKWARLMFLYSVQYMFVIFVLMVLVTFI